MQTVDLLSNLRVMFREAETYAQAGSDIEAQRVLAKIRSLLDNQPELEAGGPPPTPESSAPPEKPEPEQASDPG